MTNVELARRVIALAWSAGAREFCVCAGSRNSPLVAVLTAVDRASLFSFYEERAAAFFALGRAKTSGRPVAVVTTSGTAVAEMLPAAVEARYAGSPILLITADRPRRFRGTGAPQTIEQAGIFTVFSDPTLDVDVADVPDELRWERRGPFHINVAFDEPLIDDALERVTFGAAPVSTPGPSPQTSPGHVTLERFLSDALRPLVLIGEVQGRDVDAVRIFARQLGAPVHAEPLSGLREDPDLDPLLLRSGERILSRGDFDAVVHIGGVPAMRFWRELEDRFAHVPVLHVHDLPFTGLSRGASVRGDLTGLLESCHVAPAADRSALFDLDRQVASQMATALEDEPGAEPAMFRALSSIVPDHSMIFLGNSLPIREWDIAARRDRGFEIHANRGANGIDGEVSTFLGLCEPHRRNVAVLGDLTALYDLGALWIAPQLDPDISFVLFIVNNGGGRIFSRVASLGVVEESTRRRYFENEHDVHFEGWAAMWQLPYERWTTIPDVFPDSRRLIIELRPDQAASERVWRRIDEIWRDR